jgi:hypothetical protein
MTTDYQIQGEREDVPYGMDEDRREALDAILPAMAKFKRVFGRDPTPSFVAELIAARHFGLTLPDRVNEPGADATDPNGLRYQIKHRSPTTLNVDVNNFAFDRLVLVNIDDQYNVTGMWVLGVERAKEMFTFRAKFRKYQATQQGVKRAASRII